jgi:hypothetical protein
MNLHHGAALGLIGWYLMSPVPGFESARVDEWSQPAGYDTAQECESARMELYANSHRGDFRTLGGPFSTSQLRKADSEAICIASDDPRLKGK